MKPIKNLQFLLAVNLIVFSACKKEAPNQIPSNCKLSTYAFNLNTNEYSKIIYKDSLISRIDLHYLIQGGIPTFSSTYFIYNSSNQLVRINYSDGDWLNYHDFTYKDNKIFSITYKDSFDLEINREFTLFVQYDSLGRIAKFLHYPINNPETLEDSVLVYYNPEGDIKELIFKSSYETHPYTAKLTFQNDNKPAVWYLALDFDLNFNLALLLFMQKGMKQPNTSKYYEWDETNNKWNLRFTNNYNNEYNQYGYLVKNHRFNFTWDCK